jgi:hypothetical protein
LVVHRPRDRILEVLHVVPHPLRLVVASPIRRLELVDDRLEFVERRVKLFCAFLLGRLECLGVLSQLVDERKRLLELFVDRLLVLLEPLRCGRRNEGVDVALAAR